MTINQVANFLAEFQQRTEEKGIDADSKQMTARHMVYMLNARDEKELNNRICDVATEVFPF